MKTRCKLSDKAYFINLSHKRWPRVAVVCLPLGLHTLSRLVANRDVDSIRPGEDRALGIAKQHQFIAHRKKPFAF